MKKTLILFLFIANFALGQNSVTTTNQSIDIQSNATGTTPLLNVKLTQANPFGQTTPTGVKIESNGQSPALHVKSTTYALLAESNGSYALEGQQHGGNSAAAYFTNFHLIGNGFTVGVEQRGLGIGGKFILNNTSNTSNGIEVQHLGSGTGVYGFSNSGIGANFTTNTGEFPLQLTKSTNLATNVTNSLLFKTGTFYTGAIKTIGTSASAARMGFFTFADATPGGLLERMSINDGGNIGIGTTSPSERLHVVGNIRSSNLAGTGSRQVYADANGTLTAVNTNTSYHNISLFEFRNDGGNFLKFTSGCGFYTSGNDTFMAPLNLPHGRKITAFTVYFTDANASHNLYFNLNRTSVSDFSGFLTLGNVTSSGTPGNSSLTVTGLNETIDNVNNIYSFWVTPNGAGAVWTNSNNFGIKSVVLTIE